MNGSFVAYYRQSTDQQGLSNLGPEAQHTMVREYLNGGDWSIVAEFTEVETRELNSRRQLEFALEACRKNNAKLVIAKLGRISRNLALISALIKADIEFTAVDHPRVNRFKLQLLVAVPELLNWIMSALP